MENITKTLDFFKVANPFRDVIIIIGGLCALLFTQFFLGIEIFSEIKKVNLGRVESDLIIITLSFVFGKLLFICGELIVNIAKTIINLLSYVFLEKISLKVRLINFFKLWSTNWKEKIKELMGLKVQKSIFYEDVKNEISIVDIARISKEYPLISENQERTIYLILFLKLILPIALMGIIFISNYFIIFFIFFLFMSLHFMNILDNDDDRLYRGLAKHFFEEKKK